LLNTLLFCQDLKIVTDKTLIAGVPGLLVDGSPLVLKRYRQSLVVDSLKNNLNAYRKLVTLVSQFVKRDVADRNIRTLRSIADTQSMIRKFVVREQWRDSRVVDSIRYKQYTTELLALVLVANVLQCSVQVRCPGIENRFGCFLSLEVGESNLIPLFLQAFCKIAQFATYGVACYGVSGLRHGARIVAHYYEERLFSEIRNLPDDGSKQQEGQEKCEHSPQPKEH